MKRLSVLLLVICFSQLTLAQFDDDLVFKERFNIEVIQIEEFIQRFNFNNNTRLIKYLSENYPEISPNRRMFVASLFDYHFSENNVLLVNSFLDYVCDTINPLFLNFYDKNWFAEVSCLFEVQGEEDSARLTLMSQAAADSSSKWVITGVSSELLTLPEANDSLGILSPVSHGTDFIALYNIFKGGINVRNYLPDSFKLDKLSYLAILMYLKKISIKEISNTKYHFLQIPGWAFTVKYINRKENNTGWLISDLRLLNQTEKEVYKKDVLGIGVYE